MAPPSSTTAAVAWAGPADPVNPLTKRFLTGRPLEICDQGGFFVGGVPKVPTFGTPRQVIIGQMYVQFEIPTKRRQWPIILIHGGGLTGSVLDATPHGTEGWFAMRSETITPPSWSINQDADAPASTLPEFNTDLQRAGAL
jgi:hypothetical protein